MEQIVFVVMAVVTTLTISSGLVLLEAQKVGGKEVVRLLRGYLFPCGCAVASIQLVRIAFYSVFADSVFGPAVVVEWMFYTPFATAMFTLITCEQRLKRLQSQQEDHTE